ncbi:MAG: TlpA family protein disulfide reductase [Hylemonella sp.]|nr:TlpA family protein disulfide reductase [Hylemonella sp.]
MKRAFYLASFLVAAALGLAFFVFTSPATAPDTSFVLLDGSRVKTSDLRGKVVLVNFWATSCTTCVAEMPSLVATHRKFQPRGFETIAVAMQYDPPSYVLNFAQSRKLPFMVAIDNTGALATAWDDVRLTPTTYVLDKQGSIVKRFVGTPDFPDLDRLLESLLAAD